MAFLVVAPLQRTRNKRHNCARRGIVYMTEKSSSGPVLMCDVLDTLVADPFSRGMHTHFGFPSMNDFLAAKTPHAWIKFELGEYDEAALAAEFFKDKRLVDIDAFKRFLVDSYRLLPGAGELLRDLRKHHVRVHLCSNYGPWYTLIEHTIGLERDYGAEWTFVSAQHGARKPDRCAYEHAANVAEVSPSQCVLLDDREHNCEGARTAGYLGAVQFHDVVQVRRQLAPFFGDWLLEHVTQ